MAENFFSSFIFQDSFAQCRILNWELFSHYFQNFKKSFNCLLFTQFQTVSLIYLLSIHEMSFFFFFWSEHLQYFNFSSLNMKCPYAICARVSMYVCCTCYLGFTMILGLKVWPLFHDFWKILSPYLFKYFLFPIFYLFFSGIPVVYVCFLFFFKLFHNFWMLSSFFLNNSCLWVQYQVVSNDLSSSTMLGPLMGHSK